MADTTGELGRTLNRDEERDVAARLSAWKQAQYDGRNASLEFYCRDRPDLLPFLRQRVEALDAFVSEDVETPLPEQIDSYRVLDILGRGGHAVVYACLQASPRREVAVKTLLPGQLGREQQKRFLFELRALSMLDHPSIAKVYQAGMADLGQGMQPYFAMELVKGEQIHHYSETLPSVSEKLHLILRLCDAVECAHRNGVIHRDLKPSNILVTYDGIPKVLDFGIGRLTAKMEESGISPAPSPAPMGTPPYMSPEQFKDDGQSTDSRTDIYSLGVLCYELLAGTRPYEVDTTSLVDAVETVRNAEVPPLSIHGCPDEDLDSVLQRALQKDPNDRYPTVSEFRGDLQRFLRNEPVSVRKQSAVEQVQFWCRKHPAVSSALAVAVTALVLGLAVSVNFARVSAGLATRLQDSLNEVTRERQNALQQATLAESRRGKLSDANVALVTANSLLRRSAVNALLLRASHNRLPDPGLTLQWLHDEHLCPDHQRSFVWHWLERGCRRELAEFPRHEGNVVAATMSPDGSRFATLTSAGTICIWETDSDQLVRELRASVGSHRQVLFLADGAHLLVSDEEGRVLVMELESGRVVARSPVSAAAFAADHSGETIALAGEHGVLLWLWAKDEVSARLLEKPARAVRVRFVNSPEELSRIRLGLVQRDGMYREWDLDNGKELLQRDFSLSQVFAAEISEHGDLVVMARRYEMIVYGNPREATTRRLLARGHRNQALTLVRSPHGSVGLVTGGKRRMHLWDLEEAVQASMLRLHNQNITALCTWSDHRSIVSTSAGRVVRHLVYPKPDFQPVSSPLQSVQAFAFSADSQTLVTADIGGQIETTNIATGESLLTIAATSTPIRHVDLSPDGALLCCSDLSGSLKLWDSKTGEELVELQESGLTIRDFDFSPDGRWLLTAERTGSVRVWSIDRTEVEAELSFGDARITAVRFSPDGRWVAAGNDEGHLFLWNWQTRTLEAEGRVHEGRISQLTFTPDSQQVVTASTDQTAKLLNLADLEVATRLVAHHDGILSCCVSPDGQTIATGGRDGRLIFWDRWTGDMQMIIDESEKKPWIQMVAFSPDGKRLASANGEGIVRLW